MIVPIVMNFYEPDRTNDFTNTPVHFKRVYDTLIEHGVLLLPHGTTLLHSDFQQIYEAIDDSNKCKPYLRNILESVQYYQLRDWDGTIQSFTRAPAPTVVGLSESATLAFNHNKTSIEARIWYEIDQANLIDKIKEQRQKNVILLKTPIDELWNDYFAPPLQYVPIKKIDIIDRYSLQNAITVPSNATKNHLVDFLTRINNVFDAKDQKVSITLYSALIENKMYPERTVSKEKADEFFTTLSPVLATLLSIKRLKIVTCADPIFMTNNHDRYVIYSTGLDELSYVYLIGKGIEIFGHDYITAQTDISVRVRTRAQAEDYLMMLTKLNTKKKHVLEWNPHATP